MSSLFSDGVPDEVEERRRRIGLALGALGEAVQAQTSTIRDALVDVVQTFDADTRELVASDEVILSEMAQSLGSGDLQRLREIVERGNALLDLLGVDGFPDLPDTVGTTSLDTA